MGTPLRVFWSDRLEELADRLFAAWEGRAPARPDSATRDGKPLRDPFSRICVVVGDLSTRNWLQRHFLLHRKPGARRIVNVKPFTVDTTARGSQAGYLADSLKMMFEELTEEEQRLVKRARNHRSATVPKNADPVDYKWATAFEAIIGYYYLAEQEERLQWFLERAFAVIGG